MKAPFLQTIRRPLGLATVLALFLLGIASAPAAPRHQFALDTNDFLLDGKPFQMRSGEMHPDRIPREYWQQRIRMAKAMGLNTIAVYIFWNYHEPTEGKFDFKTGNRDLAEFFRLVQAEGMWLLVRPGPYCCAEWDFGGIPSYLLREPDLKVRCRDPRYLRAAERYLKQLARVIRPFQITRGGPILLLQIENEYGSYGNDRGYLEWLRKLWRNQGIDIPFSTGDGPTPYMLEAGSLPGCAVGLDSGSAESHWDLARRINPGVPVFSSETYPGWLTHWGESWATVSTAGISKEVTFLMDHHKSFSLYVVHGGTSFGFTAGANADRLRVSTNGVASSFQPDVTSYDYDAPINEQGRPTPKFYALRELIGARLPAGESLPPVPEVIPAMALPPISLERWSTLWDALPKPVTAPQPVTFEQLGQNQGLVLYRTRLIGHKGGQLILRNLHDYALVFLDGKFVGTVDRRLNQNAIHLPRSSEPVPVLEVLVEGMGHINFGEFIIDPKGITDRAVLNGMTLMNWEMFRFPLPDDWVTRLPATATKSDRPGAFFRGHFPVTTPADTYFDLSQYRKGVVWVNGHNLGRYWEIGPQTRLYCPANWLRRGDNVITILDLLATEPKPVSGHETLKD